MKIPKKLIAGIIGAAGSAAPLVSDVISEKIKQKSEEKEKIYVGNKTKGDDAYDISDITTKALVTEKVVTTEERRTNRGFHGL